MMGGRLVFKTMAPDKTGLSHIMTLANSNKILLGDERSNETFVIGRTETNASSDMFPYGDGSATIIKGQDAMFGHGGNVTLKGGNANGVSEIGGSIVLQPGHSSPGYEGGSIIFQDGWGTERFHINDNKLEIGTPEIDLRAQAKTVLIADGEHEALRFVTSDDESLLAFDTANGTVSIHGTLNVHGAIREEPCVISLGLGDSYLYELCGKKSMVVIAQTVNQTGSDVSSGSVLLLPHIDGDIIRRGYRVTIISGSKDNSINDFTIKVDRRVQEQYIINGKGRGSVKISKYTSVVDCIGTSEGYNQWVCELRTDDGQVVSTGSSPGLFSTVTITESLILKGSGIIAKNNNVNVVLKDDSRNALQFSGTTFKIIGITNSNSATVTVGTKFTDVETFKEGNYVYISGVRNMPQVNFGTYKIHSVAINSDDDNVQLVLAGLDTSAYPNFIVSEEKTAKIVKVISSFNTRTDHETVSIFNDFHVNSKLTTNKDILFTGPNPSISFFSGAMLNVPHGVLVQELYESEQACPMTAPPFRCPLELKVQTIFGHVSQLLQQVGEY
jgi:hypothetical protein